MAEATKEKLNEGNLLRGSKDEYSQVIATDKGIPNGPETKVKIKVKRIEMEPQMQGLAGQVAQTSPMRDLDQVIAMLIQGVTPDELIQNGVPEELVMMALEEVSKQATQVPPEQAGLAATVVKPGM